MTWNTIVEKAIIWQAGSFWLELFQEEEGPKQRVGNINIPLAFHLPENWIFA